MVRAIKYKVKQTLQGNPRVDAPSRRILDAMRLVVRLDYGICRHTA